MKNELLIMREKLYSILNDDSVNSERILSVSQEMDNVILKFYQEQVNCKFKADDKFQESVYLKPDGSA